MIPFRPALAAVVTTSALARGAVPNAAVVILMAAAVSGCLGTPAPGEQAARDDLDRVRAVYRPGDAAPALPVLAPASSLDDFVRFAVLANPRVEARYYEWAAAVEDITLARSRPDPRLTFEADITRMIESVMPGLMMDFPGPGKLAAAGESAARGSEVAYFAFERAILDTAVAVKSAYYRLHFLEDNLRLQRETLGILEDLERLAQAQNAAGRVTLQDVLRAQIAREETATQITNLEDSRSALAAQWKAALGLGPGAADPPIPAAFVSSPDAESADVLLATALARNPALRQMEADVRRAAASLGLAEKAGVPDFSLGLEADVKASPVMLRPSASVTLPIWRDKVAAEIARAQADKRVAEARLSAEQVGIAADLAAMVFVYRESRRTIELLEQRLIPKGRQSLQAARTGYATGRAGFLDVLDAHRQLLTFESSLIEARTQRELALTILSSTIAGIAPAGSPVLPADEGSAAESRGEVKK